MQARTQHAWNRSSADLVITEVERHARAVLGSMRNFQPERGTARRHQSARAQYGMLARAVVIVHQLAIFHEQREADGRIANADQNALGASRHVDLGRYGV